MSKTQSVSAPGSRDSDGESWGVSVKVRFRGQVVERGTSSTGREHDSLPSSSLAHAVPAEPGALRRLRNLDLESSGDEDSGCESEAEETDCSSLLEGEIALSATYDDDTECDPDFDFVGADLYLKAGDRHFWVHTHMFKDFNGLESRLDKAPMNQEDGYKLLALEDSAEDIHRALAVIYTKPYDPHAFDFETLESCLNLATKYENLDLRNYAIQQLEGRSLKPIDEFRLGRDYGLVEWRSKSISTLSRRDEPLTEAEAATLGPTIFSSIAAAREKFQYARGQREAMGQAPTTPSGGTPKAASSSQRPSVSRKVPTTPGSREQLVPSTPSFPSSEFAPRLDGGS